MNKMNPVVHFEMPYEKKDRVVDFYGKAFGWQFQMMGPEMGNYVTATTSELDEKTKFPKKPGMINGGFYEKMKNAEYPSVVIAVDDIMESIKQVEDCGGKILGGQKPGVPDEIPGVGKYISFLDTEGNRVGMLEPSPMMN
jgi:uncharacterized protein